MGISSGEGVGVEERACAVDGSVKVIKATLERPISLIVTAFFIGSEMPFPAEVAAVASGF